MSAADQFWRPDRSNTLLFFLTNEQTLIRTMNINIEFSLDGTGLCLWTDAISLHELGRLEIHRATNIEFNNATQQWEVIDRKDKIRFFAKSRAACLEWEHEHLQPG